MYLPPHFDESRPEELRRLIAEYPLGALVLRGPAGFDANHLPFLFDAPAAGEGGDDDGRDGGEDGGVGGGKGRLLAHVARNNPLWREAKDGDEALVIFRGPDAYVSPNWYPTKHEAHRSVPTWNYQVVHAHGTIRIHDDEPFVRGVVARLTREHETRAGQDPPWKMTDSARDYIDQQLRAIVGIEVRVDRLVGKFKLSQNREERDRVSVATELDRRGDGETASAMRDTSKG